MKIGITDLVIVVLKYTRLYFRVIYCAYHVSKETFISFTSWRSVRIFKSNFSISGLIIDLILLERALGYHNEMSQILEGFFVDSLYTPYKYLHGYACYKWGAWSFTHRSWRRRSNVWTFCLQSFSVDQSGSFCNPIPNFKKKLNLKCKSGELISGHINPDLVFDRPKDKLNPKTKIRKNTMCHELLLLVAYKQRIPTKKVVTEERGNLRL